MIKRIFHFGFSLLAISSSLVQANSVRVDVEVDEKCAIAIAMTAPFREKVLFLDRYNPDEVEILSVKCALVDQVEHGFAAIIAYRTREQGLRYYSYEFKTKSIREYFPPRICESSCL